MKSWFYCLFLALAGSSAAAAAPGPKVSGWTAAEAGAIVETLFAQMQEKGTRANGTMLGEWETHTAAITVRSADGIAELHGELADFFIVLEGEGTLVTGGTMINASEKSPGELRATAIKGGDRRVLRAGDMAHIPAGVAHQLLVNGRFAYYVIKARTPAPSR